MRRADFRDMPRGAASRRWIAVSALIGAAIGVRMLLGVTDARDGQEDLEPIEALADPAHALADQAVTGGAQVLRGVLADPQGRRELHLLDPLVGADEVIADAGWHLPPAGARSGEDLLVCFNSIPGDPEDVRLLCRRRAPDGAWRPTFDASPRGGPPGSRG